MAAAKRDIDAAKGVFGEFTGDKVGAKGLFDNLDSDFLKIKPTELAKLKKQLTDANKSLSERKKIFRSAMDKFGVAKEKKKSLLNNIGLQLKKSDKITRGQKIAARQTKEFKTREEGRVRPAIAEQKAAREKLGDLRQRKRQAEARGNTARVEKLQAKIDQQKQVFEQSKSKVDEERGERKGIVEDIASRTASKKLKRKARQTEEFQTSEEKAGVRATREETQAARQARGAAKGEQQKAQQQFQAEKERLSDPEVALQQSIRDAIEGRGVGIGAKEAQRSFELGVDQLRSDFLKGRALNVAAAASRGLLRSGGFAESQAQLSQSAGQSVTGLHQNIREAQKQAKQLGKQQAISNLTTLSGQDIDFATKNAAIEAQKKVSEQQNAALLAQAQQSALLQQQLGGIQNQAIRSQPGIDSQGNITSPQPFNVTVGTLGV